MKAANTKISPGLIYTLDKPEVKCSVSVCSRLCVDPEVPAESDRATPEPVNPDEIEISVNYEPDPTDLMLSSVPGGQLFDPRKHRFSEEDLKPQPMIKKAKKVFVPEEQKVGHLVCVCGLGERLKWTRFTINSEEGKG